MPSSYTLNNGIELIATGEQSGTWGDTTNVNLSLIDTSLDGQVTITLASAGNSASPNTLPINDGSASNGRNRMVIFADSSDLGATAYVQLTPNDAEKIVYVRNNLSGSRSVILFQGTYNASNDYEIPSGTTAIVYFNGAGSGAVAANVFNNAYFDSLRLGSVSVTAILDEDNMASDSPTALATQQSIKAYVDNNVTAQDLDFAGDTGTGAVDLDSQTFTVAGTANEVETAASGQTITIGLPSDVTVGNDLTVTNDLTVSNDAAVTGNTTLTGTLGVTGNSTLSTLDVTGAAGVDGDFDVATNKFTVASASGNTSVGGTLGVSGNTTLSGTLGVTGATTLSSSVGVTGAATLSSTLGVTGNTTMSTFTATGDGTFSGTGQVQVPSGTTGERSGSPANGMLRYNTSNAQFEGYAAGAWGNIGGGAEAGGAIVVNNDVASQSYTIASGENGFSVGPMTVSSGVSITVSTGQRWVVI
jgi:hypothetical protein